MQSLEIATGSAFIAGRPKVQSHPVGPSRTKQSFADAVNINDLVRRHDKGQLIDHINENPPKYGDFINAPDYHTALNLINDAQEAFMSVPADIRSRFANDPAAFLEFVQNEENLPEMREMGLALAQPPMPPLEAPTTPKPEIPAPEAPKPEETPA